MVDKDLENAEKASTNMIKQKIDKEGQKLKQGNEHELANQKTYHWWNSASKDD